MLKSYRQVPTAPTKTQESLQASLQSLQIHRDRVGAGLWDGEHAFRHDMPVQKGMLAHRNNTGYACACVCDCATRYVCDSRNWLKKLSVPTISSIGYRWMQLQLVGASVARYPGLQHSRSARLQFVGASVARYQSLQRLRSRMPSNISSHTKFRF